MSHFERQKIGAARDVSSSFVKLRAIYKKQREEKTRKDLNDMALAYKLAPNSSSTITGVFQSIIGDKSSSKDTDKSSFPTSSLFSSRSPQPSPTSRKPMTPSTPLSGEFCIVCGDRFNLINKKGKCRLCEIEHCQKCLLKLTKDDISGIQIAENEIFMSCVRCNIIFVSNTKHQAFLDMVKRSQAQEIPVVYNNMQTIKEEILKIMPKYEYLALSILDPEASSPSNAATFQKVYEDVLQMQNELLSQFQKYESEMKRFNNAPTSGPTSAKLKNNIKIGHSEFLQLQLPKFKGIHKNVLQIVSNTVTNMYFVLARTAMDNKANTSYWSKFGKYYTEILHIAKEDMQKAVMAAGDNWEQHKKNAEDLVCTWEPSGLNKSNSFLNLMKPPDKEFEGTLIRKSILIIYDPLGVKLTLERCRSIEGGSNADGKQDRLQFLDANQSSSIWTDQYPAEIL